MLMPKKTKYRKAFKGRVSEVTKSGNRISFGDFAIKALESDRIDARQIESARRAMTRYIKRGGKIWIRIFPSIPVTKKPAEVKMGHGKGALEKYVSRVEAGRILFELGGVSEDVAREAMRLARHKLPIKTKFIKREVL